MGGAGHVHDSMSTTMLLKAPFSGGDSPVGGRRDFNVDLHVHSSPLRLHRLVPEVGGTSAHDVPDTTSRLAGLWEDAGEPEQKSPGLRGRPSRDHFSMTTALNLFKMFLFVIYSLVDSPYCAVGYQSPGKGQGSVVGNIPVLEGFGFCPELFIPVAAGGCLPVLLRGCDTAKPHN